MTRLLLIYLMTLVGLFVLNSSLVLFARDILHAPYPYNTSFFRPDIRFNDWTNFTPRVAHYGEPDMLGRTDVGAPYPYPLTTFYLYLVPVRLTHDNLRAYLVLTISTFALATFLLSIHVRRLTRNKLPQAAIWLTLLLGFPAVFTFDRGNIEVFLWLTAVLGLLTYLRRWHITAALLFALAASMKIYPAIFLLLLIPRKQYKAFALGILAIGVFTALAMVDMSPHIRYTLQQMKVSSDYLWNGYIVTAKDDVIRFDHSILAVAKQLDDTILVLRHHRRFYDGAEFPRLLRAYSILAPLAFVLTYLLRLRRMPLLNQFLALSLFSVLLPYVSYEYTLVQVYTMFGVFLLYLLADVRSSRVRPDWARYRLLTICFAVAVAPITLLAGAYLSGQVKCVVLLVMLVIILRTPMPSSLFGDLEPVQHYAGGEHLDSV